METNFTSFFPEKRIEYKIHTKTNNDLLIGIKMHYELIPNYTHDFSFNHEMTLKIKDNDYLTLKQTFRFSALNPIFKTVNSNDFIEHVYRMIVSSINTYNLEPNLPKIKIDKDLLLKYINRGLSARIN